MVTITVEKTAVVVVIDKFEKEEWSVKGHGTGGDEVITFYVIKWGEDDRRDNKSGCEEKNKDSDKIVENNRHERTWEINKQ